MSGCTCEPCPGRGRDGHGMLHCAECCYGSLVIDPDPACPTPEHRALAAQYERARRDAIEAKGDCPDTGRPIRWCSLTICDCPRAWEATSPTDGHQPPPTGAPPPNRGTTPPQPPSTNTHAARPVAVVWDHPPARNGL